MKLLVNGVKNLVIALLVLVLGFNLYSLYQRNINDSRFPMVLGYGYAVVASGSMEPTLSRGDLVIVRQESAYEKGNIITFIQAGDQRTTTHRIVEAEEDRFITQGDGNNLADESITAEQIFGKVVLTLPLIGYLIQSASTPLGLLVIIALFLLMFYLDSKRS